MLKSDTKKDFEKISETEHLEIISEEIMKNISKYFQDITKKEPDSQTKKLYWHVLISEALENYEKDSAHYREFFHEDSMDEFEEVNDPKVFKSAIRRECPIIRKTLMSSMEQLQKWKEDFMLSKPQELLDTFANSLDLMNEYIEGINEVEYLKFDNPSDFNGLSKFSTDEKFSLHSVLGTGIISTVLYSMEPKYLCKSVRRTLYGFYFLSMDKHKSTPSRTSEFVMIDDTNSYNTGRNANSNFKIEHNFWYPYNLFMYYSKMTFDNIETLFNEIGINLDPKYRYVYVNLFLEQVAKLNAEAVKTMMGGDQDF